jgi:RNA recognition motif-containing protein
MYAQLFRLMAEMQLSKFSNSTYCILRDLYRALPNKFRTFNSNLNIAMKLFVAGLPYDLYDDELVEIFEKFGTIASAKVALDKETGKSRGFAFVDMPNEQEAREAMEHLNDISLGKKPLVIKEADERSSGGGFGGGNSQGYRGGGNSGGYNGNRNNYNNNRNRPGNGNRF